MLVLLLDVCQIVPESLMDILVMGLLLMFALLFVGMEE